MLDLAYLLLMLFWLYWLIVLLRFFYLVAVGCLMIADRFFGRVVCLLIAVTLDCTVLGICYLV